MTTRTPIYIILPIMILLIISYILSERTKRLETENKVDKNKFIDDYKLQNIISSTALLLSVVGFIIYIIEKHREYGTDFSWVKFLSGNLKCRHYTPEKAKLL